MEKKPGYITLVLTPAEARAVQLAVCHRELRLEGLPKIRCFEEELKSLHHVNESLRSAIDEQ